MLDLIYRNDSGACDENTTKEVEKNILFNLISLDGDGDSDEDGGGEEHVGGDEEDWEESQVAR